jgi:predicted TIM-barrel fold metal-dependent hydrolase
LRSAAFLTPENCLTLSPPKNIGSSSDYPHSDSDFPKATQEFFHQEMPADSRRKILWDNCVKFYGIAG